MSNEVIRDPSEKEFDAWRVVFNGRLTIPTFMAKGAAEGYLQMRRTSARPGWTRLKGDRELAGRPV